MAKLGVWLWNELLGHLEYDYLRAIGCDRLYIKTGDGSTLWPRFDLLREAKQAGFEVYSWTYNYGRDPVGEAEVVLASLAHSDGHVLDAESEFRDLPNARDAAAVLAGSVVKRSSKPLLVSSFARIDLHGGFPVSAFGNMVDSYMPQVFPVYWPEYSPSYWELEVRSQYRAATDKPVEILWEPHNSRGVVEAGYMRTLLQHVWSNQDRLNLWRYGTPTPEAWRVLEEYTGLAEPIGNGALTYNDLVNRLGYLTGDVAAAIRNPVETVFQDLRRPILSRKRKDGMMARLAAALDAVSTLERHSVSQ